MDHPKEEPTGSNHEFSKPVPTTSAVLGDRQLVELVYDRDKRRTSLAVWNGETWRLKETVNLDNGRQRRERNLRADRRHDRKSVLRG